MFIAGFLAAIATGCLFGLVNGLVIAYLKVNSLIATLGTLPQRVREEGLGNPAILVFSDVVSREPGLARAGRGPLAGRTVVVTRARAQASEPSSSQMRTHSERSTLEAR